MKISVIVPVYNTQDYLRECVDSILNQSLSDIELILVDDGSTDFSTDIIFEYVERFPAKVKAICLDNGGQGRARNFGIDAAQGEFLSFIDSDDYLSEGAIIEMMDTLKLGYDMCIFDINFVNGEGHKFKYVHGCSREGFLSLDTFPQLLFEMPSAWNKIYRRTLFIDNEIFYPRRIWYEDMYVTPWLYTKADKIYSIHKGWHNYVQRAGSITNNKNTQRNLEIIPAVDAMLDAYKQEGVYEKYKNELEYSAFYNQVLTSITRVNLADPNSDVQDKLLENYIEKFPDYLRNPYIKNLPRKYKLIHFLIKNKMRRSLHLLMRTNNRIKGK